MGNIQAPLRCQRADHHAVCSQIPKTGNLFRHLQKFLLRIQKISKSGTNQNIRGNPQFLHLGKKEFRRCCAPNHQVGTKLQPIAAAFLCRQAGAVGIHAYFK